MEDDFDPEGYHAGILARTNNGVLVMDEADSIRQQTMDSFLSATQDNTTKPDQLRFSYPSNQIMVWTANDIKLFRPKDIDRMTCLRFEYPENPDVSYEITRRSYYGEYEPLETVKIKGTHKEQPIILEQVVQMPATVQRTVDALYLKFRKEFTGEGKTDISVGQRSKEDALHAARALLLIDNIFHKKTPAIANAEYAMRGIQYAIISRIMEPSVERSRTIESGIDEWVRKTFPELLKQEENTWWCRIYKNIASDKLQIPEVEENFVKELKWYETTPVNAVDSFDKLCNARKNPSDKKGQLQRVKYPFMNHLFKEQSLFSFSTQKQVEELIRYFLESSKNTTCRIDGTV